MQSDDQLYEVFSKSAGVCTDTRKLQAGQVFFALSGPNFNGNRFAQQALRDGAVLAVVDQAEYCDSDCLLVDNCLEALQNLARMHRRRHPVPMLGITGSNGKTTTKELITAVLSSRFSVYATRGNLNNHIGVPLTVLGITADTEFAIVEMGANHLGEIAMLCDIAMPDDGLITNIGRAHLEGFGGLKGVQKAKGELYDYIKSKSGHLFRYSGDPLLAELAADYAEISTYGFDGTEDVSGVDVSGKLMQNSLYAAAELHAAGQSFVVHSKLVGAYNVINIAAAAAVGLHNGVSPAQIVSSIEAYCPSNNRSQLIQKGETRFVMDAYNANPASVEAALHDLAVKDIGETKGKGNNDRPGVILGDMLELGSESAAAHRKILELVRELGFDPAVFVGPLFGEAGASEFGFHFESTEQAGKWLVDQPLNGKLILLKGSRGIALELVFEYL